MAYFGSEPSFAYMLMKAGLMETAEMQSSLYFYSHTIIEPKCPAGYFNKEPSRYF